MNTVIDSFIFYNELELLEFRLKLLYEYVDHFVIVEADKTFSGKDKPFYFEQSAERFAWARDKIVYHKASLSLDGLLQPDKLQYYYHRDSDYFKLEFQHRNAIATACEPFDDSTILFISDLDEIPSREAIIFAKNSKKRLFMPFRNYTIEHQLFYYKLDYQVQPPTRGTVITTVGTMRGLSPQTLRNRRSRLPLLPRGGWHLSYFGDSHFIANKIESFAHQEFNRDDIKDHDYIARCVENGLDLFGREDISLTRVPRSVFPEYFLTLAETNEPFFFCATRN